MRTEEKKGDIPNSISRLVFVGVSVVLQAYWVVQLVTRLYRYSAWLQLAFSILALVVAVRVYGRHMNAAYKILWMALILVMPIMGLSMYLLFGNSQVMGGVKSHYRQADAIMEQYLTPDENLLGQVKEKDRVLYNQMAYIQKEGGFPAYTNTDICFYGETTDALAAQKEALRTAEHFIFMEYHAIQASTAWQGLEDILAEKAKAGVDVRVLYDDMGSIGFVSGPFVKHLESRGIRCKVFNPLIPVLNIFMNNRDHRKITVVDNRVGFTGGYNLADEYFHITAPYGQWKDSGVRMEGDAVKSLTLLFLEMWSALEKKPIDPAPYLLPYDYTATEKNVVVPYADSPLDEKPVGENVYLNMIQSAEKQVYITTPYLIISDEMERALTLKADSGVDVRLVTPGIPDKKLIFRITRSYYARLAAHGVRIYEYTPGFLHAKQFLMDDKAAAVGTINLDFRSLYLHFENGCWFAATTAVKAVREDFEQLFGVSTEVTEQYAARRSLALRGWECVLRLFSPLL